MFCTLPGAVRGNGGQFVALDCNNLENATSATAAAVVNGYTCIDNDIRSYYGADEYGHSTGFTRWRTYDPRLRGW